MSKVNTTNSVVEDIVDVENDVNDVVKVTEKNMNEENKKNAKKSVKVEPLKDFDEIEVISLIPNVSYKDSKTNDMYEWDEVGHSEYMTFDTLKNMWRNNKGYFRNMWLRPNDDRVINQFGLTKTFEKYEFLMDKSNYTKDNIEEICKTISEAHNGLKCAICHKVKDMVVNGEVANLSIVKALEKHLKIDLIDSI